MPALTLTLSPAERRALRSQAHPLKPVVLIGADGLTDAVLNEISVHLDAHELIKIRVFGDDRDERASIHDTICERLSAAPIQHIGKLLVIWRPRSTGADTPPQRGTIARSRNTKARTAPPRAANVPSAGAARSAVRRNKPTPPGAAPRIVRVVKPSSTVQRPKPQLVKVLGNERVTAGGNVKKAKKRRTSTKRQHQSVK